MRRNLFALMLALLAAFGCGRIDMSDIKNGNLSMVDFSFGYTSKSSLFEKMMHIGEGQFTTLNSQETFDLLRNSGNLEEEAVLRNKFEYREDEVLLTVKPNPERGVGIQSIECTSSDKDIVEVVSTSFEGVTVKVKSLGDVDLYVKVTSKKNSIEHVYPLRVIGTVDLRFRITPFWLRKVATKIRMNTRKLPEGVKDMVMWSKDSVTVVGYCEWYDFKKAGRTPLYKRDTTTYPMDEFMCHYKKFTLYLLRDVTDAIRKYSDMYVDGTKLEEVTYNDGDGEKTRIDTVHHRYSYIPEQVILSYVAVCDNPFIEFVTTIRSKKTFDTFPAGKEPDDWYEESDDVGGGPVEDRLLENEDDEEGEEDEKETSRYFKVELNDFLTQRQRDSLENRVKVLKKQYGYDEELTEEQKDKAMDEINKNL